MTWVKVILFIFLWGITTGQIIIYPISRDTVVKPPRDLTLGCENTNDANISWTIPDNNDYWASTSIETRVFNLHGEEELLPKFESPTQDQIEITYELIEEINDEKVVKKLNNASLLILKNFSYHYIGNYYCHETGSHFDDEEKSRKIFVYFNGEERLSFLPHNKKYVIDVRSNIENVTFPCIPTSPNISVKLSASSSLENNYYEMSSEFSTFNLQTGYNVKITEVSSKDFVCEFERRQLKQNVYFHLVFDNYFDYNIRPFIDYPEDVIHIFPGETLTLKCNIVLDNGNWSSLLWNITNKNESELTALQITNTRISMNEGRFHSSVLKIDNITEEYSGEYICKINQTDINGTVARKYVFVEGYNLTKPKISSFTPELKAVQILSSSNITLVCESNYDIVWTAPFSSSMRNENCVQPKSKYKFKICFTITNATYNNNTGYYYCHSVNATKENELLSEKVFIFVPDEMNLNSNPLPVLRINTTDYTRVTIPCIPTAPDINVKLLDASTKAQVPFVNNIVFEGITIVTGGDDIVHLECLFTKENRTETQKVMLDVRRSYRHEFEPSLSTTEETFSFTGGDLVLICSVIVRPDFNPNISWATPGQPEFFENQTLIRTDKSEKIANGKVVISTVTVKDVQLGDYRQYECSLKDDKNKTRYVRQILSLNIEFNIKPFIETKGKVCLEDTIEAKCTVRADHNIRFEIQWSVPGNSNDSRITVTDTNYTVDVYGTIGSNVLRRKNVTYDDVGNYTCKVKDNLNNTNEETVFIDVLEPKFPQIYSVHNMENKTKEFKLGISIDLRCQIDPNEIPTVNIVWYKNNKIIANDNRQEYSIVYSVANDTGIYSCNVSNRLGSTSQWVDLKIPSDGLTVGVKILIGFLSLLISGFAILSIIFTYRFIKERKFKQRLQSGIANFGEGQVQNLNPDISISDQVELLPYNKKWEVPRSRVKLGKKLGSGEFGVVYKGEVFGVFPGETIKTVAIKTVHRNTNFHSIKALVNELKILTYIGKHVNVVNLCGACTVNIEKKEILIITEFCHFGNLRNYLMTHRDYFINQIDAETGLVDIDNIDPTLYECYIPSEKELSKSMNPYANLEEPAYKVGKWGIFNKSYYKLRVEKRHEYENIRVMEKENKYISTHDLLCWSYQVARGMEYISSRRILHGDLAARNVLLTTYNIVKICDFGLSKNMYKYKNYRKKTKTPLPVKWMALESVRDRIFSTKSDVWSFGITLWEFFSLGSVPYPEMQPSPEFIKELEKGYRMPQPEFATSDIYQIMTECWKNKPADRPDFAPLVEALGAMIHNNVRKHYIELNKPYENLNITEKSPDYIEILKKNHYMNLISDSEMKEDKNIEQIEMSDLKLKMEDEDSDSNVRNCIREHGIQNKKTEDNEDIESDQDSLSNKGRSSDYEIRKRFKNVEVEIHQPMN